MCIRDRDRAWRRRRLLVLCRAFVNRSLPSVVRSDGVVGLGVEQQRSGVGHHSRAKIQACSGDDGRVGGTLPNILGGGNEARGNVCQTEVRVVGLAEDSLFRLIVSFL